MTRTVENLEAWAITQGYDYEQDYVNVPSLPEGYLSPNFREAEFACNHCGRLHENGVPSALLDILEDVRAHFGKPVNINSGYRCPTHNANVGGAKNSMHMLGIAADFWIKGVDPADAYAYLDPIVTGGLGKYNTFTHVDVRDYKARWQG